MPKTLPLKLTVYQPKTGAGEPYDLTIVWPDLKKARRKGDHAESSSVEVTGTLSFPNLMAPVISPFRGKVFIRDLSPMIVFPLTMWAESTKKTLKFKLNLAFPGAADLYSGAITFGEWPGPLSNVTASFLSPETSANASAVARSSKHHRTKSRSSLRRRRRR
jgi:hypothetical protein